MWRSINAPSQQSGRPTAGLTTAGLTLLNASLIFPCGYHLSSVAPRVEAPSRRDSRYISRTRKAQRRISVAEVSQAEATSFGRKVRLPHRVFSALRPISIRADVLVGSPERSPDLLHSGQCVRRLPRAFSGFFFSTEKCVRLPFGT